jgi:hypothetical protein
MISLRVTTALYVILSNIILSENRHPFLGIML